MPVNRYGRGIDRPNVARTMPPGRGMTGLADTARELDLDAVRIDEAEDAATGATSETSVHTTGGIQGSGTSGSPLDLTATGVAAGTYAYPSSQTVDAQGRTTAIVAGTAPLLQLLNATLTYTQFIAGGGTVTVGTLPAGSLIVLFKMKHSVSFTGGTIISADMDLGITGNPTKYITNFDVHQAPGNLIFHSNANHSGENHGATVDVIATLAVGGGALADMTQGSVEIWVFYVTAT